MNSVLMSSTTKKILKILIRNDFDKIDFSMEFIYEKANKLIDAANEIGLNEFANELLNDKETAI